jgi:ubiquinone/menaquinone biosynthesis C-methylase UbiE
MADEGPSLREQAMRELARPRPSVVAALDMLGLQPGMRVLDAGCGPGAHLHLFAERVAPGGSVAGLDADAERVELAGELNRALVESGALTVQQGDITSLPFADDAFDLAWCALVLHHVEAPAAGLRELVRVVRPGGMVAAIEGDDDASLPLLPWPPEFEARLRAAQLRARQEETGGHLDHSNIRHFGRELTRMLREAGLADIRIQPVSDIDRAPHDPAREAEIAHWFSGLLSRRIGDYLAPVDRQRLEAYVDPASETYLLNSPDFFMVRTWFLATGRVG